jgi:hypothetical protein
VATYARSDSPLELPRAGRAAAPFAALAVLALAFVADPRLPWLVCAAAALVFGAAGALRAVAARRELAALRRAADRLILRAPRFDEGSALLEWRARELTCATERARVRRDVERTLRSLDGRRLPGASPLRRPAARRNASLLRTLADRLADERSVSPRGILLAETLLREPGSPLYNDGAEASLPRALSRVLAALEP